MKSIQPNSELFFAMLREKEYSRLDKQGHVYLDYTAGNIYPSCLVDKHCNYLQKEVYGNPHSANPASLLSGNFVNTARERVLDFFNATDYHCIFTQNATGALQIVGECYPFSLQSHFLLTADNHNSVNGIREYCGNKGGEYSYCKMNRDDLTIDETHLMNQLRKSGNIKHKLFAFPAQSNASGVQHSLDWIGKAKELGWDVLLDAAAFVPTSKLDLSAVRPDFVSISFYKIFGYPTGLGCLLVKKTAFAKLKKSWFAGGTVELAGVNYSGHILLPVHDRFENGTINYLDIPSIANGLDFIDNIGMANITARIKALAELFLHCLPALRHQNGRRLIKLYGPTDNNKRGGNFLMNFYDSMGRQFPIKFIEHQANLAKISLRTGCFCNPGIDELNNGLSAEQLQKYFTSGNRVKYDDMTHFFGKMRGAVRISFGIPTTRDDIDTFIHFANKFINREVPEVEPAAAGATGNGERTI
ncbi:MAG: aminotransferase class V-fold PLP-dependent enzyme [Ferruginibacter sp.]